MSLYDLMFFLLVIGSICYTRSSDHACSDKCVLVQLKLQPKLLPKEVHNYVWTLTSALILDLSGGAVIPEQDSGARLFLHHSSSCRVLHPALFIVIFFFFSFAELMPCHALSLPLSLFSSEAILMFL